MELDFSEYLDLGEMWWELERREHEDEEILEETKTDNLALALAEVLSEIKRGVEKRGEL